MKCQNLFSGKMEKYFNMLSAENFTRSAKWLKQTGELLLYYLSCTCTLTIDEHNDAGLKSEN